MSLDAGYPSGGVDAASTAGLPPQRRRPVVGDPGLETGATTAVARCVGTGSGRRRRRGLLRADRGRWHVPARYRPGDPQRSDAAGHESGRAELLRLRADAQESAGAESRLRADDLPDDLPLSNRRAGELRGYAAGNPIPRGFLEWRALRGAGRRCDGTARDSYGKRDGRRRICFDSRLRR